MNEIDRNALAAQIANALHDLYRGGYEKGFKDATAGVESLKAGGVTNWEKLKEVFGDTFTIPYPESGIGILSFRDQRTDALAWAYRVYEEPGQD